MGKYLNSPENIESGFLSVDKRIKLIEEAIGYAEISKLSACIADLLFHIQPEEPSLNSFFYSTEKQSQIAICILNASIEIQTAYHILTVGNVPGVFRQCRLVHEYIAAAIFSSVPKEILVENISSKKHLLIKEFNQNPELEFWDLYKSNFNSFGTNIQRIDPIVKGNALLPPYFDFLRKCTNINEKDINWLIKQVNQVMHPASHGSIELLAYHFGTFAEDGKGGLNYSKHKISMYKDGMSYLLWTLEFLIRVLDSTRSFIENKHVS